MLVSSAPRLGELGADVSTSSLKFFAFFIWLYIQEMGAVNLLNLRWPHKADNIKKWHPRQVPGKRIQDKAEDLHDSAGFCVGG